MLQYTPSYQPAECLLQEMIGESELECKDEEEEILEDNTSRVGGSAEYS